MPKNPWTLLDKKTVYESPWVRMDHHEVLNPVKKPGTYSVVHFKKLAIGVLPLDKDYNTWIVGQYRYPLDTYTWEIPEGGGSLDVDPIETGKRELLEECGIIANKWTFIQHMQLSNSATDELAYLYVAQDLSFTQSQPDDDEELKIRKVSFDELYEMVLNGEVIDSLSVAAVLKVKLMLIGGLL